jgi:uncharacterized membrane protein (DUF106 family)
MSQDVINMLTGGFGAVVGWVLKVIWDAIKELQAEMRDFQNEVHVNYVHKDDYRADIKELKDIAKQIFDKLDRKADR